MVSYDSPVLTSGRLYICKTFLKPAKVYEQSRNSGVGPAGETVMRIFSRLHTMEVNPETKTSFWCMHQASSSIGMSRCHLAFWYLVIMKIYDLYIESMDCLRLSCDPGFDVSFPHTSSRYYFLYHLSCPLLADCYIFCCISLKPLTGIYTTTQDTNKMESCSPRHCSIAPNFTEYL